MPHLLQTLIRTAKGIYKAKNQRKRIRRIKPTACRSTQKQCRSMQYKSQQCKAQKGNQQQNKGIHNGIHKAKAKWIKQNAPLVIFTTVPSSLGINFYTECYPIMTCKPETREQYLQIVGRSNRLDYSAPKKAALFTSELYLAQNALEANLELRELNQFK